ncbi:MAG: exopolysaccharide biosynthesis polyprenyl glycosylphosphotransferase [Opitutaceae bacterium]|nr:exopolysaccharide biosynthesis polyprenyl glycosylphosphotransferase [Opitutaceae bacterium]MBP9911806.1 exopolysaccharide biosynthesis polyprenyl glycosylphosphotransferase [Opitutaceae bacterium]
MKPSRYTSISLLLLDMIAVFMAFNISGLLRGVVQLDSLVTFPLLGPLVLMLLGFYLIDGYKARTDMLSLDYASQHLITLLVAMLCTLLITFVLIPSGYTLQQSRSVVASSFLLLMPITLFYRRAIYNARMRVWQQRSLVFVGDAASCLLFAEECQKMNFTQPVIYTIPPGTTTPPFHAQTLMDFDQVLEDIEKGTLAVEALVLRESSREFSSEISQKLMRLYFSGVPTYGLELFHQVYWRKIPIYRLNQAWLFQDGFQIAREPVFERAKRASDLILAALGLILATPLILLAGVAIWLEDRGPVFFTQSRIGRNRITFPIVKLRTMRVHQDSAARYTQEGDRRITRVGRFLRASRIDEFPQLWNVLRGDMSLIGPRAEWERLVVDYERDIPCYHFRHLVKPGITGWAQVNYPYGASLEDTIRKLEYDLYYIRHFSFLLDAAIVLKTLHIMLFGKGR